MKTKKTGRLAFTVTVEPLQFVLHLNGSVVGYHTTVEGLLNAVRQRAIRAGTKRGQDLDTFIRSVLGLQTELKNLIRTIAFTTEKKIAKGPSKTELAENIRARMLSEDMIP